MKNSVSISPVIVDLLRERLEEFDQLAAARREIDFDSPTWPEEAARIESQIVTLAYRMAGALGAALGVGK